MWSCEMIFIGSCFVKGSFHALQGAYEAVVVAAAPHGDAHVVPAAESAFRAAVFQQDVVALEH